MTRYAVAHGTAVLGTYGGDNEYESSGWIKWMTDLEFPVAEVASNWNGSIIAASTTDGSVSILRGADGEVLVTKSISSNSNDRNDVKGESDD